MNFIQTSISDSSIGIKTLLSWLTSEGFKSVRVIGHFGGAVIGFEDLEEATLFQIKHCQTDLHKAVTEHLVNGFANFGQKMGMGNSLVGLDQKIVGTLITGKYKEFFNHKTIERAIDRITLEKLFEEGGINVNDNRRRNA